jgi:type II secretory pathway pseudopilin PulG
VKLTDRRQAGKRKEQLSYAKNLVKDRKGTTLVETMVTLFLISILMAMAASALSSASRIFVRIQKTQYAQSVLDTTMTELRTITKDATGYVKLYERTTAMDEQYGGSKGTNTKGNAIEFMTPEGFVELVSANGWSEIHIGDKVTGTADAVETGQLLTRYYFRNSNTGQYIFTQNGKPVARAVANVFAKGFYMGNYVEVEYSYPANVSDGSKISSITAKVTVYSEYDKATKSLKNVMATDTEVLEFRNPITVKGNADSAITAIHE